MKNPVVLIALLALASGSVDAQQRNLRGIITDSAGYPLPNVEIRIMEIGRMSRSDIRGNFAIDRISDRIAPAVEVIGMAERGQQLDDSSSL